MKLYCSRDRQKGNKRKKKGKRVKKKEKEQKVGKREEQKKKKNAYLINNVYSDFIVTKNQAHI